MRIEQRSGADEKKVLTGMILDRQVLSRIAAQWKPGGMFRSPWCNLVGNWCVEYLSKYDAPPKKEIQSLYNTWAETANNKTVVHLIGDFLETLSDEYEAAGDLNAEYLIDLAGRHFNTVQMEALAEAIQSDIASGNLTKAIERVTGWNKVELGVGAGVDVLNDTEAIREAFEAKSEALVTFPGALGEFFGTTLERDGFIGIMGPDKRGKSYWLAEIAYRALLARRRVAFFECGDLSQAQVMRRLMCRVSKHPLVPCTANYPVMISRQKGSWTAEVEYKEKVFSAPLSWRRANKACQELITKLKTNSTLWKLSCHPNSSISISGIKGILAGWEREGWVPDVVVIDYADILASDNNRIDIRHQINETWKQMRALSQSLHCLVVTATQSDADAYRKNIITRSNFSEDKRKLAHVTGMVGLNQTIEEKDLGITRLNWVVRRDGAYSETKCVHVAGCLALANPAVVSCW